MWVKPLELKGWGENTLHRNLNIHRWISQPNLNINKWISAPNLKLWIKKHQILTAESGVFLLLDI